MPRRRVSPRIILQSAHESSDCVFPLHHANLRWSSWSANSQLVHQLTPRRIPPKHRFVKPSAAWPACNVSSPKKLEPCLLSKPTLNTRAKSNGSSSVRRSSKPHQPILISKPSAPNNAAQHCILSCLDPPHFLNPRRPRLARPQKGSTHRCVEKLQSLLERRSCIQQ